MSLPSRQGYGGRRSRLPSNFTQLPWDPNNTPAQRTTDDKPQREGEDNESHTDNAAAGASARAAAPSPPPLRAYPANPYLVRHNPTIAHAAIPDPARGRLARNAPPPAVDEQESTAVSAVVPSINTPAAADQFRSAAPGPPPTRANPANPYLTRLHPANVGATGATSAGEMRTLRPTAPRESGPGDMGPPPIPHPRALTPTLADISRQFLAAPSSNAPVNQSSTARLARPGHMSLQSLPHQRDLTAAEDRPAMEVGSTPSITAAVREPHTSLEPVVRPAYATLNPKANIFYPLLGTPFAGQPPDRRPERIEVRRDLIIEQMAPASMPYPNAGPRFPVERRPGMPIPATHVGEESARALTRSSLAEELDMNANWRDNKIMASPSPAPESEGSPLFVTPEAEATEERIEGQGKSRDGEKDDGAKGGDANNGEQIS